MTSTNLHARNWIAGEWDGSGTPADSFDPATGEVIGTYADAGEAEAARAIAAAAEAFRSGPWRHDRRLRAEALNEMADRFEARADDLVGILSLENGKVKGEARFEVGMVPRKLRFYAALALTDFGRAMETSPGRYTTVLRQPMGVAGIIAPWNSPIVLFIRSLAPALAAGCTVVGKLPGLTAQTERPDVRGPRRGPVPAQGRGQRLLRGRKRRRTRDDRLPRRAGDKPDRELADRPADHGGGGPRTWKRFGGELGGKTPIVLFADADLDKALPVVEKALTTFAGQFCMTGSRLLVQRPILDAVRERLGRRLEAVRPGPAADPSSDMGPLINMANVDRVDRLVEDAIGQGARAVVRGGRIAEGPLANGAFYRPTLLEISDHSLPIAQDEVFGPVLVMHAFDSEDEAVTLSNDSIYGLAASIWSSDVDRPLRVARQIEAGTVWINNWAVVYDESEEGGFKQSGLGRLNGVSAIDDFVEYRTIIHEVALMGQAGAGQ